MVIASKDELAPQLDKVATIEQMTSPKSKQDIQVFLGMFGYMKDLLLISVKMLSLYFIR